jgi:hypothetical protein
MPRVVARAFFVAVKATIEISIAEPRCRPAQIAELTPADGRVGLEASREFQTMLAALPADARRACVPLQNRPLRASCRPAGVPGIQNMTSEKMRGHGIKHSI